MQFSLCRSSWNQIYPCYNVYWHWNWTTNIFFNRNTRNKIDFRPRFDFEKRKVIVIYCDCSLGLKTFLLQSVLVNAGCWRRKIPPSQRNTWEIIGLLIECMKPSPLFMKEGSMLCWIKLSALHADVFSMNWYCCFIRKPAFEAAFWQQNSFCLPNLARGVREPALVCKEETENLKNWFSLAGAIFHESVLGWTFSFLQPLCMAQCNKSLEDVQFPVLLYLTQVQIKIHCSCVRKYLFPFPKCCCLTVDFVNIFHSFQVHSIQYSQNSLCGKCQVDTLKITLLLQYILFFNVTVIALS